MSWLSSAVKSVGKIVPSVGSMIGGKIIPGGNIIGSAVQGAVNGKGGVNQIKEDFGKGVRNTAAILPVVGKFGGGSVSGGPPLNNEFGDFDGASMPSGNEGGGGGWLDAIGGFIKDHGGDIAKLGLTAAAGYEGIKNSRDASALNKDALARIQAPLAAPDLNYIFADKSNPFKNGRIPVVGRK